MGKFHVRDELYFERGRDGDAVITWPNGETMSLDASSWASVVAHVSAAGETGETYRAALAFHDGA